MERKLQVGGCVRAKTKCWAEEDGQCLILPVQFFTLSFYLTGTFETALADFNCVQVVWHLHLAVFCIAWKTTFLVRSGLIHLVKDGKITRARACGASIFYMPTIYI